MTHINIRKNTGQTHREVEIRKVHAASFPKVFEKVIWDSQRGLQNEELKKTGENMKEIRK